MNRAKVTAMVAAAALTPLALAMTTAAGAAGVAHQQDQSGAITIQSWLYAVPSENLMSATVWDCFKITGAINDEGGGPTWTDDTSYHAPNTMTSGRRGGGQQGVRGQGAGRRVHPGAAARGGPVPVRPVHIGARLARRPQHPLCRPHHRRSEGRYLHNLCRYLQHDQ